jgi:hypothetical protein
MNKYGGQLKKKVFGPILILLFILAGCAQVRVYSSNPAIRNVSNVYYDAEFEPQLAEGRHYFNAFRLVITNKTDKDLVLDWTKTYYLLNGRRNGQFGWDEMSFEQLQGIKDQPLVTIRPENTLSTVVFPLKLIAWEQYRRGGSGRQQDSKPEESFYPGVLPEGESGISLYVKQANKVIQERLTCNITLEILKK